MKILGGLLLVGIVVLVGIQLIPVDRTNPPVVHEPNWDSQATRDYAERACFDCHSNETTWPWYSYVAPISWFVADHVHEGRSKFNVSEWPSGEGDEAAKEVREGGMPLWEYTVLHPDAKLTQAEQSEFIAGLEKTFGSEANEGAEHGDDEGLRAESDNEVKDGDD
ncbi:MAG: heme-binding domain-containing protein [Anaerolineae bacterium]|nr:heme-binding domain-containing protein [Anaerolineae bacterium]